MADITQEIIIAGNSFMCSVICPNFLGDLLGNARAINLDQIVIVAVTHENSL